MLRIKSFTHRMLESLSRRMDLEEAVLKYLAKLDDGHEGELDSDDLMAIHLTTGIVLKNLRLKTPLGECQIDTLVIKGNWLFVCECKNWVGEYIWQPHALRYPSGSEVDHPEAQLQKQINRLNSLLRKEGLHFNVAGKVIYINPTMTMYHAPEKSNFIMRSQVVKFLQDLNRMPDYPSHQHPRLLHTLKENEKEDEIRFDGIPEYTFEGLQKGLYCVECGSLAIRLERNVGQCKDCQSTYKIADMLARNLEEFKMLFPEMKMKPKKVGEWCGAELNPLRVKRALKKYNESYQTSKNKPLV